MRVNAAPPAVAVVGEIVVIVGVGLLIVNVAAPDVPPPGAGFVTVTFTVPPVAICAAVIAAVNCVEPTNVVVAAEPLRFTVAPFTNAVPLTVSVNAAPPAAALVGERMEIVGGGFVTVKFPAVDIPPPGVGLVTVTGNAPTAAMSAAVMAAVI